MANKNAQDALNVEDQLSKSEAFFDKNKKTILIAIAAVVLVIAGFFLYKAYVSGPREDKASTALAKGQEYFNNEMFDKALNGDGTGYAGFVKVADDYSGTDAANLANLYAGLCYAHLGNMQEAASYLENYDAADDAMVSPAAVGALADVKASLGELDEAVELFKKAADKADNNTLSPQFLIKAGEILESQGKKEDALKLYEQIKAKYLNSMEYGKIDAYIERVK